MTPRFIYPTANLIQNIGCFLWSTSVTLRVCREKKAYTLIGHNITVIVSCTFLRYDELQAEQEAKLSLG